MNRFCWTSPDQIEHVFVPARSGYVRSDDGAIMVPMEEQHCVVNEQAIPDSLRAFLRAANKEAAA